jgi:uracil phosphoribosyltransferase
MSNYFFLEHPLIKRDITILRDKNTSTEFFRSAVKRISNIIAVEIAKSFHLKSFEVETPLERTKGYKVDQEIVLIPILRAGLGMVSGFIEVIPEAKVGHIGLKRDENTLIPIEYYYKTPSGISNAFVILLDPMLATGGSASEAVNYLKRKGAKKIVFSCLVAAPEGLKKISELHPDVKIFGAALDRKLNDKGYILPGLGDAGDRTFGTF